MASLSSPDLVLKIPLLNIDSSVFQFADLATTPTFAIVAPFVIDGYPNTKGFKVRDVVLPADISDGRASSRHALRRSLDQITRRIIAHCQFRKQDKSCPTSLRAVGVFHHLRSIAREISNRRIDLSQRDLHASSLKRSIGRSQIPGTSFWKSKRFGSRALFTSATAIRTCRQ